MELIINIFLTLILFDWGLSDDNWLGTYAKPVLAILAMTAVWWVI